MLLYTKVRCLELTQTSWERHAYDQFEEILINQEKPFPCTLGIAGFNADQLRYCFVEALPNTAEAAVSAAAILQSYLPNARSYGKNTSLVIFFKETRDLGIQEYESIFWSLLNKVHLLDTRAWPHNISKDSDSHQWEFSFAGEPIFVVCNTPSHKQRLSRYGEYFTITFQPRWVFNGVIGEGAPNSAKIKETIRSRLSAFDSVPPSPYLGTFGDASNKEWAQYYLDEKNQMSQAKCPFNHSSKQAECLVEHSSLTQLDAVISEMLPPTGSVEVQTDTPFRIHPEHLHTTDETLHILKGDISFQIANNTIYCRAGDRLLLPAYTKHASVAGENGCIYVIANRLIHINKFTMTKNGGEQYV